MDTQRIESVHFVGVGGVGMSGIARVAFDQGLRVSGSDLKESRYTKQLKAAGIDVRIGHDPANLPGGPGRDDAAPDVVVVSTAILDNNPELIAAKERGLVIWHRAQMLAHLGRDLETLAVAGTHGKTTTSTMVAWFNRVLTGGGSAFLGGISKNFGGNLVLGGGGRLAVEADEFDRSFLRLYPDVAVVTSADADHLDIYGTHEAVKEAFSQFVRQIRPDGFLIVKQGVDIVIDNPEITVYRYAYDTPCDFYARNVQLLEGGHYRYDIVTPGGVIAGCTLGIPGWINIENSVAAVASVWCAAQAERTEPDADKLREALASFSGVKRRFEFYVNTPKQVYMDDYAHHPRELAATLTSVRGMFPGRRITALFQPHLYTRTRDLYAEFAEALSHADEVVLLPIYPAREEPIPGIASEIIADRVAVPCRIVERERLADEVAAMDTDVVISFGAGNIDACCEAIAEKLRVKS